jgi:hypothetical protein
MDIVVVLKDSEACTEATEKCGSYLIDPAELVPWLLKHGARYETRQLAPNSNLTAFGTSLTGRKISDSLPQENELNARPNRG